MATWNSRGLRGSTLEEMINRTNEQYREKGLALIQKVPTPITPVRMEKESRRITLAYFDQKSTVDYIGAVQGIPVCFDAKECATQAFPIANIHEHQVTFMKDFEKQGGVAFLLILFSGEDRLYYLPFEDLMFFWNRAESGGLKHFKMSELNDTFRLTGKAGVLVPYLEGIQRDLTVRDLKSGRD
uniref:Holliday junction resolvase RecU n=1 Tax=Eubacterium cellulosolvens TaxID=29322 RepID=UPI0004851D96|nr:Holliday junction resolvase RecU [[Eubacterium] cellulosolvens]